MTNVHDFRHVLQEIIEEKFPNTTAYIVNGVDLIIELRQEDKKIRYSPYELFIKSEDYEDTIEEFLEQWKTMLEQEHFLKSEYI